MLRYIVRFRELVLRAIIGCKRMVTGKIALLTILAIVLPMIQALFPVTVEAAALTLASSISETQESTLNTTYTASDTTIASGSLPSGMYLVTWGAAVASANSGQVALARLVRGSTEIAEVGSVNAIAPSVAEYGRPAGGYWLGTLSGSEALTIQYKAGSALGYIDSKFIKAVRLDSNLVADTDYWTTGAQEANTVEATDAVTGTYTTVKTLTKTFDASAAQDYIILASMENTPSTVTNTNDCGAKMVVDGSDVTLQRAEVRNIADVYGYMVADVRNIGTGSKTITLQGDRLEGTNITCNFRRSRIYVLRASIFDQVVEAESLGLSTTATGVPWTDKITSQTYTPNQSENVMIISSQTTGASTDGTITGTRINNTTDSVFYTNAMSMAPNSTTTPTSEAWSSLMVASLNISTAKTFKTQFQESFTLTTGTPRIQDNRLIFWSLTLKPPLSQSGYRFSVNADNTHPDYIQDNLTASDDSILGSTIDTISSVFYGVGTNTTNWVMEKRRVADGSLCTSTNCGTTFGTDGRITEDVAGSATEKAYAATVDASGGFLYVVGIDNATGGGQWRIEKRNMLSGALITAFDTDGIVTSNPSAGLDEALAVKLDAVNGFLYVGGYDGSGNNQWRIEKYKATTGALCTAAACGTEFGTGGVYLNNVSNGDDRISNFDLDPTNTYLYVSGFDAKNTRTQWTVYKLKAATSAACTAAECGTQFGVNGLYNSDPSTRDDKVLTLQVDSAAGAIYLGGYESPSTSSNIWRIEKITLDTGVLISAFGNNGSCTNNNTGAVCASFSGNDDKLLDMTLDGAGGYLYMIGIMDESGTNSQWRLQKRNRSDGSLVSAWATSGTASFNPSANNDPPTSLVIDVDRGLLWAMGGDRTLGTTNMQWRFQELQLDTGTMWMAAANTIGGVSSSVTFRLRLLLHVNYGSWLTAAGVNYKLQYSPKVGTCDTAFVGENYVDMATSGTNDILYQDNPSVADGVAAVAQSGQDPTHSSDTVLVQGVEESNNFTNLSNVAYNQDALVDFAMKDNGAFGAYCFRVVDTSGVVIAYTQIPELTFCKDDPKTNALLRHGTYFCEGQKKSFFWIT